MNLLTFLMVMGLLFTAGALVLGVGSMAHGGEYDRSHTVRFMSARVFLQGLTLLIFVVALFVANL